MSYDELYDYDIKALYNKLEGFLMQKQDEWEAQRILMVEQTVELVNISGKMVKKPVTFGNYGIKLGNSSTRLSPEQIKANIEKAKSIKWVV